MVENIWKREGQWGERQGTRCDGARGRGPSAAPWRSSAGGPLSVRLRSAFRPGGSKISVQGETDGRNVT